MRLQVEINGMWYNATPQQLKAMALDGRITPETRVRGNGKTVLAANVKGLEFGDVEQKQETEPTFVEIIPLPAVDADKPDGKNTNPVVFWVSGIVLLIVIVIILVHFALFSKNAAHDVQQAGEDHTAIELEGDTNKRPSDPSEITAQLQKLLMKTKSVHDKALDSGLAYQEFVLRSPNSTEYMINNMSTYLSLKEKARKDAYAALDAYKVLENYLNVLINSDPKESPEKTILKQSLEGVVKMRHFWENAIREDL